ncbi:MAG: DNA polymerase IV [Lentisphaerae bacterium]|nr:DNA polymerase IV [Lentisphaerota bacterium]
MERTILHVDMDAFFTSVEQRDRPELRGQPVVVGAPADQRGVVAAASYEARQFGIHSAMPSREAYQRCPQAVFLPPDGKRYMAASRQIRAIFDRFTPHVEPLSIDEAFLDVSGVEHLFGRGEAIARQIKDTIRSETELTASAGVAPNKFLAKLASDMEKPDGLTVVPRSPEAIAAFLAPLSISRIWGVGKVTRRPLEAAGIHTIGQLQACNEVRLASILTPRSARHLLRLAWGEDDREVETEHEEKSISHEHTFTHDCSDYDEIRAVLADLADNVGRRLRASSKQAGLARLKLRWEGFKTITRQRPLMPAVCDNFSLRAAADQLLENEPLIKPVRLVGFGVSTLTSGPPDQLSLFEDDRTLLDRNERLSHVIDAIQRDFGRAGIHRGSSRQNMAPPEQEHLRRPAQ